MPLLFGQFIRDFFWVSRKINAYLGQKTTDTMTIVLFRYDFSRRIAENERSAVADDAGKVTNRLS